MDSDNSSVDSPSVDSASVDSASVDSASVDSASVDSASVDSASVDSASVDSASVNNELASFEADPSVGRVLITQDEIAARIAELGRTITKDYEGRSPLMVCVLKGAVLFAADLARQVDLPLELDFMAVSSYGSATRTSGVVRILKDLDIDISGRDVILVEDIVDSGLTLTYLRKTLMARQPSSLEVCSLLVREERDDIDELVRYIGFRLPPDFVLGYGLDVAQKYRNLRDIRSYIESS
ncbi:MAG: hypoxanthine phosphoribosyltransferase [Candidatus Poriferisodalaceae bacterium]